jgi:hypothetical protein
MGFNRPADDWPIGRSERRRSNSWLLGLVLVLVGVLFLLQNVGIIVTTGHWWAIFILIPAVGSGVAALTLYEKAGRRYTPAMAGPLTGFVILTFITAMFFFDLSWGQWWPVFIIIAGLSSILGRMGRSSHSTVGPGRIAPDGE